MMQVILATVCGINSAAIMIILLGDGERCSGLRVTCTEKGVSEESVGASVELDVRVKGEIVLAPA